MGLIRFDGHKFSTRFEDSSIPVIDDNNEVFDLVTDQNGNIVVAGTDGIVLFNPESGKQKKYIKIKR